MEIFISIVYTVYLLASSCARSLPSSTDQCAGSVDVKRNASLGLNSNVPLIGMTGNLTAACSEYWTINTSKLCVCVLPLSSSPSQATSIQDEPFGSGTEAAVGRTPPTADYCLSARKHSITFIFVFVCVCVFQGSTEDEKRLSKSTSLLESQHHHLLHCLEKTTVSVLILELALCHNNILVPVTFHRAEEALSVHNSKLCRLL